MFKQTLNITSWNSEIQQSYISGKLANGNNFRLQGMPAKGSEVNNCIVNFVEAIGSAPQYDATNKCIVMYLPYATYHGTLQFIQTAKVISVYFGQEDNGDATAFLYDGGVDI